MEDYLNIKIHKEEPKYIAPFAKKLLEDFYLKDGENFSLALARVATAFCYQDYELAQRIYDYAYKGWFMFASPIISNAPKGEWKKGTELQTKTYWEKNKTEERKALWQGEKPNAMPISCYALYIPDTIDGQIAVSSEVAKLSVLGGGVGLHNGIRTTSRKAPGPIPFMKTIDGLIGYYKQSQVRRGACAYYMDVNHPDILEFIRFRVPSGGDVARKSDNRKQFHNAVNITDEFINAVDNDLEFNLVCPHTKEIKQVIKARDLWEEILEVRALTGEPYLFKIDEANRQMPQTQKDLGLKIHGSNICCEITLPTSEERTFVCCLSSVNAETFDEWKDTNMVQDLVTFLDNVVQFFIDFAPPSLSKAVFSAEQERAIGIGVMGYSYYLQKNMIPFEGGGVGSAIQVTHQIFSNIKNKALEQTKNLAKQRGEPNDMKGTGRRNSRLLAVAPNSNNAIILNTSLSIEPLSGNSYSHSTRAGTFLVKNKYLEKLIKEKNLPNEEDIWQSIIQNNGSIQHLDCFNPLEKKVFKTAFELDQHWIIEQANERQNYVCQSQSLNVFFPKGVDRAYFNSVHLKALKANKLVSVYYCRMNREIKADVVKEIILQNETNWDSDDCIACSG